jgi:flagellar biosynthesis protein FliQ
MDGDLVLYLARRTFETALLLSAPTLIVTLVIGFVVAMLQAVTSIRDQTMGQVIKLAAVALIMLFTGSWTLQVAVDFTTEVLNHLVALGLGN